MKRMTSDEMREMAAGVVCDTEGVDYTFQLASAVREMARATWEMAAVQRDLVDLFEREITAAASEEES